MFRCEVCKKVSRPREKATKVVVETFEHIFPFRSNANTFRRNGKVEHSHDYGGRGSQIGKEIQVCNGCAAKANGPSARNACAGK